MNNLICTAEEKVKASFRQLEEIEFYNAEKVLKAFQKFGVNEAHFASSSGYGYDDFGRDTLEEIYAEIFGTEDAIVRHTITSGTHALTAILYGLLLPGDHLLAITGKPYDTLEEAIGIRGDAPGSLKEFGVTYGQVDLKENGDPDYDGIAKAISERNPKVIMLQRSKGYSYRKSLDMILQNVRRMQIFLTQFHIL